ncbi:putative replication factor c small subunit [Cotonvirus japonicus]|uniref:Replication factor c small subunit n=1 Tax=Cotonvirus japonicus TaxID=2811091 RepID=A0ABM7NSA0_9VIRU|nr:putative replication factor c small subunit [Cotonvirus japonicus]BCS83033.1 putative replication factor c small subunit [Cotonvirus japonicus]
MTYCETISKITDKKKELPWTEKYRPQEINHIISHNEILLSLKKFIESRTLPHLLFFGPSGSGKTSTIKCCANEIYGKYINCMILELNASNERGIETVRTKIKNFVSNRNSIFLPENVRDIFKLVILDEIDSMTVEAQGMLRQTIEKNSTTTRFCLICNDIDKINIALQSRCASFRFSPLSSSDMRNRLIDICSLEKIKYEKGVIDSIVNISKGDMRSAINTLQHVNLTTNKKITVENVYKISGHCTPEIISNIFNILHKLTTKKTELKNSVEIITSIVIDNNITIFNLLQELKNIVMDSDLNIEQKLFLVDNFAKNEVYDAVNVDSKNILMILACLFVNMH